MEDSNQNRIPLLRAIILYVFVFFSGFASLAVEIIGPRLFSSLFGSTTVIWAVIISVTLVGISIGYYLGGRVPVGRIPRLLPILLVANAAWLVGLSWIIWELPAYFNVVGFQTIIVTALVAFFIPAVIFSTASPMIVSILSIDQAVGKVSRTVGNVFALSTLGSVLGALAAAFFLIPYVGLSQSLRAFALISLVFAVFFAVGKFKLLVAAAIIACLLIPEPDYHWESADPLLVQREGYYDTIRVYSDNHSYIRMHLGPTYQAQMKLPEREPEFGYAKKMVEAVEDPQGKEILIIGGAGHTQAHALENRGARVTEVEIDPIVVEVSDKFFGAINGKVVAQDGRTFINQAQPSTFDYILVDAYNGPASVPPQLTTREFFEGVKNTLKPGGIMVYNFIGIPGGEGSDSFRSLAASMSAVFPSVHASSIGGENLQNIIFIASAEPLANPSYPLAPCCSGAILTDNLNPIEVFLERAKQGQTYYFR